MINSADGKAGDVVKALTADMASTPRAKPAAHFAIATPTLLLALMRFAATLTPEIDPRQNNRGGTTMIHVIAIITAKPGQRDHILEAFRANMAAVRAEQGCIEYGPAIDAPGMGGFQTKFGPDVFVVIEKWASKEALAAHAASPHMASYGAKTKEWIASRVIHVLEPAD